jgi:hypothetical protein
LYRNAFHSFHHNSFMWLAACSSCLSCMCFVVCQPCVFRFVVCPCVVLYKCLCLCFVHLRPREACSPCKATSLAPTASCLSAVLSIIIHMSASPVVSRACGLAALCAFREVKRVITSVWLVCGVVCGSCANYLRMSHTPPRVLLSRCTASGNFAAKFGFP